MKLDELYKFKQEVIELMNKYYAISVESSVDGYLENLLSDIKYTINELESTVVS